MDKADMDKSGMNLDENRESLPVHLVDSLNALLRLQLMAVQQHFIHIIMLKSWGDTQTLMSIEKVDEIDLPNAMKIINWMISNDELPALGQKQTWITEQMPCPGGRYLDLIDAERNIENALSGVLAQASKSVLPLLGEQHEVSEGVGEGIGEEADQKSLNEVKRLLIEKPLAARACFAQWMQAQGTRDAPEQSPSEPMPFYQHHCLDNLFAHLVLAVNQLMVHAFVHWHGGEREVANATWGASAEAMMQLARISELLALRRLAPDPLGAYLQNADRVGVDPTKMTVPVELLLPEIDITLSMPEALTLDQALYSRCARSARTCQEALTATPFEDVCRISADYFSLMTLWKPGSQPPKGQSPCLDFERILASYVL